MATRTECRKALAKYGDDLGQHSDVVGLGIVPVEDRSNHGREMAVAVYVKNRNANLPLALRVSCRGRDVDVPIKVIVQGEISLE